MSGFMEKQTSATSGNFAMFDANGQAVDSGEKGDGAGLYVAYDNEAKEPEAAPSYASTSAPLSAKSS